LSNGQGSQRHFFFSLEMRCLCNQKEKEKSLAEPEDSSLRLIFLASTNITLFNSTHVSIYNLFITPHWIENQNLASFASKLVLSRANKRLQQQNCVYTLIICFPRNLVVPLRFFNKQSVDLKATSSASGIGSMMKWLPPTTFLSLLLYMNVFNALQSFDMSMKPKSHPVYINNVLVANLSSLDTN
jgi:hypothetical protein